MSPGDTSVGGIRRESATIFKETMIKSEAHIGEMEQQLAVLAEMTGNSTTELTETSVPPDTTAGHRRVEEDIGHMQHLRASNLKLVREKQDLTSKVNQI